MLTEARPSVPPIRPPEERVDEPTPIGVEPQSVGDGELVNAPASGSTGNRRAHASRCSFCRAELGEGITLTISASSKHGQRGSTGCFCSVRCRNCVLALAALHPSSLATADFISTRALLTDRLLDLWRQGRGPDPALVLQAAERASCGFPTAAPTVLTGAHAGAQTVPVSNAAIHPIGPSNVAALKNVERTDVPWSTSTPRPAFKSNLASTPGDDAGGLIFQPVRRLLSDPA